MPNRHVGASSRRRASVAATVGAAVGAAAFAIVAAAAFPWLVVQDVERPLSPGGVGAVLLGSVLSAALLGSLGVAFGSLIPSEFAALVAALGVVFVDFTIFGLLPEIGKYGVVGAAAALTGLPDVLWRSAGFVLLLAYVTVLAAAGCLLTARRDIS